jgi:serine/threonine protein phosphatase 1
MQKEKTFVIGDIHGAYKALMQCLVRSNFNYQLDTLICLGDVCDGWSEVKNCFEELLKIKNLIYLLGNHDDWTLKWAKTGVRNYSWIYQGGQATIESYPNGMPQKHIDILNTARLFYIDNNKLFVHAGILLDTDIKNQNKEIFIWDRTLVEMAIKYKNSETACKLSPFEEIFLGHTPTIIYGTLKPINACEIWMMDTGAGWNGVLTIMNIENKEFFYSDNVIDLYPNERGRF